jgi:hypothetical protein
MLSRLSDYKVCLFLFLGYLSYTIFCIDMTTSERAERIALRSLPEDRVDDHDWEMMDEVLGGTERMDASHAGGEFEAVLQGMEEDICAMGRQRYFSFFTISSSTHVPLCSRQVTDHRTRSDRTEQRTQSFKPQMESLVDAYIRWIAASADVGLEGGIVPPGAEVQGSYATRVVDVFSAPSFFLVHLSYSVLLLGAYSTNIDILDTDSFVATSFVRQGFIPCAPIKPTVACSIRILELYRVAQLRCPRLAHQPWVKALCDLHGVSQILYSI